ncbi:UNVERIFIED_CONTAM: hypothetical protein HDU68_001665 [Siphonaria sp. JEL0065]|nr:hypothetical protein HDU68_001665 [Siphonaria sp. JEL0065]
MSVRSWEKHISREHERLKDVSTKRAQVCFLDYVRQWRCYGCSFFPVTQDAPPGGFFEFRQQKWMIGVGPDGIVVFERDKNSKYKFVEIWGKLKWVHSSDTIIFVDAFSSKNTYKLISPQAELIHNLCARIAHLVRKGSIKGIGSQTSLISPIDDLAAIMKLHPATSVMLHSTSTTPVLRSKKEFVETVLGSGETLTANPLESKSNLFQEINVSLAPETDTTTELNDVLQQNIVSREEESVQGTTQVTVEEKISQIEAMLIPESPFVPLEFSQENEPLRTSKTPIYQEIFSEAQVKVDMLHAPTRSRARSLTPLGSFQGSERSRASSVSAVAPIPQKPKTALKKSKSDLADFSFLDF